MEREKVKKLGSREFPKFTKNNKIFYCYLKILSNKYRKNSKTNKFKKILEIEKATRGLVKFAHFAKQRKSNDNFSATKKDCITNIASVARMTNLTIF